LCVLRSSSSSSSFDAAAACHATHPPAADPLYTAIFSAYIEHLLADGQSLEFFVEGTRSRSGKMLHPKIGLLSVITGAFLDKKVGDLTIVPININYEKTMYVMPLTLPTLFVDVM
jgi:glycerol-3-phosphate O-acyltransferase